MSLTDTLMEKAVSKAQAEKISVRELSERLGFGRSTLGTASSRKKLSPTIAAKLADYVGENKIYWAAVAGIEGDNKDSKARDALLKELPKWAGSQMQTAPEGAVQTGGEGHIRPSRRTAFIQRERGAMHASRWRYGSHTAVQARSSSGPRPGTC